MVRGEGGSVYASIESVLLCFPRPQVKISYKKKRFRIRFRAPGADESAAVETRSFFTGPAPQAKKVWRNAVEQHTFFR